MGMTVRLERLAHRKPEIRVDRGSRVGPNVKNVATLTITADGTSVAVELNKLEADTVGNALKAAVR